MNAIRFILGFLLVAGISAYALITIPQKRRHGHSHTLCCPRCGHRFPALNNPDSGKTIPTGGYTCEHCSCRMDEFGNELMSSPNSEDPSCW